MANRNFASGGKLYMMETKPVLVSCRFDVQSGNASGIANLRGPLVKSVFMHTSTTPTSGSPNPASGVIYLQLQDNYNKLISAHAQVIADPLTGSDLTSVTNHTAYQITALGTATLAQWQAKGLPVGLTPTVGQSFIATATGSIGGSATVKVFTNSGIDHIELAGHISARQQSAINGGALFIFQCLSGGTLTAPANGSTLSIDLLLSDSSVLVQGE